MVPVENLLLFSEVHTVMLAWLRLTVALTSQFFLSDIGEDAEVPLSVNDDQPVRRTKVYFGDIKKRPSDDRGDTWSRTNGGPVGWSMCSGHLVQIVQLDGHPALGPWD